jgi:NADH-quinone oxidoreductase subunit H
MFNYITDITSVFTGELINIVLTLLFVLTGGVLPLWERKFLSLIQRRVGPKFVGYKGRLQFIADALKVLLKDYLMLFFVNKYLFFALPVIFLNINLLF